VGQRLTHPKDQDQKDGFDPCLWYEESRAACAYINAAHACAATIILSIRYYFL
jgi:hypothetical protein